MEEFDGVTLEDIPYVEKLIEVQIHIMSFKEDGTATAVYQASTKHPAKVYLNMWGEHLSLIPNCQNYAKEYLYKHCGKVSGKMVDNVWHERKCDGTVKYKYQSTRCLAID